MAPGGQRTGHVAESNSIQANARRHYKVHRGDLPLSCPTREMMLWNSHPRVYLPIEASGEATCPYCGAHYRLVDQSGAET
jgi:uncharacterized Zn-finger protein